VSDVAPAHTIFYSEPKLKVLDAQSLSQTLLGTSRHGHAEQFNSFNVSILSSGANHETANSGYWCRLRRSMERIERGPPAGPA
jgi:hypothetical protein